MKQTLIIISILLLFTACKPTSSIVTSKDDAIKKGIYKESVLAKTSTVKNKRNQRDFVAKQVTPQLSICDCWLTKSGIPFLRSIFDEQKCEVYFQ